MVKNHNMYYYYKYKQLITFVISFVFYSICFGQLQAQSIDEYIKSVPVEYRVEQQTVNKKKFELAADKKQSYKPISRQNKVTPKDHPAYQRYVIELQNANAVEDHGNIGIDFNPRYRKILFHHIRIIRNGEILNLLELEKGKLFRTETDQQKLLFNGRLRYNFAVEGLRVGDRLDYAYILIGKNYFDYYRDRYPTLEKEKSTEVDVDEREARFSIRSYYRIVNGWDKDEEKNRKTFNTSPYDIYNKLPSFSGAERNSPYAIPFPAKIKQTLVFKVDDSYFFEESENFFLPQPSTLVKRSNLRAIFSR